MAEVERKLADRIATLEAARFKAMIDGDVAALGRLLSDDMIYTHSTSLAETKAEYLQSVSKGLFKYRKIDVPERRMRAAGGTVLVTGRITIDVIVEGTPKLLQSRFLDVWTEENGEWRMIAWQSTSIPAPAA